MRLTKRTGGTMVIDFTLHGYSYRRKQAAARKLADRIQAAAAECAISEADRETIAETMETIGARFGLLGEFKAAGIC